MLITALWAGNSLIIGCKQSQLFETGSIGRADSSTGATTTSRASMTPLIVRVPASSNRYQHQLTSTDNQEMGFMNGAQTDLFAAVGDAPAPAPSAPAPAPAPAPASSSVDSPASTAQLVSSEVAPAPSVPASSISSLTIGSSSLPPSSSAAASPSLSLSAVASSLSIIANVQAANSASMPSSSAARSSSASAAAASPTSASGKTCRRKRRRSLGVSDHDVKRHQARAARIRNRTIGVRHTTVVPRD